MSESQTKRRRVVQLCSVDNGEGVGILSAVADDGSVWCFRGDAWVRMPELPPYTYNINDLPQLDESEPSSILVSLDQHRPALT
jgi:streptogramin lyase